MSLSDLKIICDEYIIFYNNIINNVKNVFIIIKTIMQI